MKIVEVYFSFCFVISIVRTKIPKVLNNTKLVSKEFGKELLAIFGKFESIIMKICNYKNNIRTHKSDCIIQRAEKSFKSKSEKYKQHTKSP